MEVVPAGLRFGMAPELHQRRCLHRRPGQQRVGGLRLLRPFQSLLVIAGDVVRQRPAEDLKKLYTRLDRDKEMVVYCQSGVRAQVTATVLRELGFKDVKVYEPSWLGYAGVFSAPAEDEVFLNVGALNGRIASLQGRVAQLETALAKAQAPAKQ